MKPNIKRGLNMGIVLTSVLAVLYASVSNEPVKTFLFVAAACGVALLLFVIVSRLLTRSNTKN